MKALYALVLLCAIHLVYGFVFTKHWSIKRISITCSPPLMVGHVKRRSDVVRRQQVSDEPLHSDVSGDIEDTVDDRALSGNETGTVLESTVDPVTQATADYEKQLAEELQHMETALRSERGSLTRVRDRLSESGKNGYFIVQAQVNDFTRRKDKEQKERVGRNKREFVEKMLPVVDAFRNAPLVAPATSEKELNMHKSYGSLLSNILTVFGKYGYTEFTAAPGELLNPQLHQVGEVRDWATVQTSQDCSKTSHVMVEEGAILETLRAGMRDSDGGVLRKALVAVRGKKEPVERLDETSADADMSATLSEGHDGPILQDSIYEQSNYEDDE